MSASNEETSSPVVAPNDVKIDVEDPVEESEVPIEEPSAPVKEGEGPVKEASGPVKEVENEKPIGQDEDDEEPPNIMKDLLPWIVTAGIGVILLIAAVIVMATRKEQTFRFPYTTEEFNIPDYLGSVRVKSVGGQDLRYISELRQIGSPASRATRYKLEPQLEYIYGNASLPVDNVVVIAFKYGASNTLASRASRSVSGRSGNDGNEHSVVAKHWLYLKKNITKSTEDLQTDFVAALSKVPGIVVDETSIKLESLENMTKAQAIVALAQAGFFSKKYGQLDQELLDIFGLNPIIDIQTDDDDEEGLCRSLSHPSNGKVYPQACTTSISTYAKMACSFTCDPGFDLEGSPNRICMGSGLWSGEPVKCHKKCPPLEHSTVGSITPQSCSHANSSSGQLCFTECPSENYQMIFPSPITVEKKLDMPGADLFDFNNYALKEDSVDPLDDVRTYLQRCGSDGEWNGIVGTCKTKCATLVPPENGVVEPSTCVSNPLEGDECSVSCNPGFAMADGADYKLLTCEVSGTWTGEISPCHESCPMHSANNSVNVSPLICMSSTYEGLSCKYFCDAGNSLVGASKRTCHGGSWDAEEPTCVQLCDALPNPENGVFMSTAGPCSDVTLLEGTECIVHCDTGSRAVENSTVCLPSGQWSRENITCEKMCRPLVPDRYGDWLPAGCTGSHFAEPGACNLSCSLGFQLTGPGTVTCAGDGTWDIVQGQCEANCPGLTAPTNGYLEKDSCIDGSAVVGSTCEFSCRPSFRINGDRVLTCEAGWSASAPTCTLEEQFHIVQEVGGKVTCLIAEKDGSLRKVEEVVGDEDRCVSNYASWTWQNDNIVHAVHRTCLVADSGSLLFHLATCEPSDSMQKFTGDLGNTVKVKDENIYMTSGYRTVLQPQQASDIHSFMGEKLQWRFQNTASGVGINLYGLSEMRQCPPLVLDSSVTITNAACGNMAQNNGTLCAIKCSGSTLSDRSSAQADVECRDGEWLVDLDVYCVPAATERCSALSLGSGVTVTPTSCGSRSNAGTTCEMQCSDPTLYNLDGPATVQCLDSGRWSPREVPACRKRCQSLLPLPDNSYLISGDSSGCTANDGLPTTGSVCAYGCHDGFAAIGQSILTCMADGEWSAPAPKCVQLCDPLENIDHGNIGNCSAPMHMGKYTENTKCVFTCEPGYMPDVSISTISCRGGAWNMESVGSLTCVPVCQGFAAQPHTWVSNDCRSHLVAAGTQCTFTCEDGYGLNTHMTTYMTSMTRTCQADGSWTGSIATCSRRCPAFAEPEMHGAYFDRPECQSLPQRPHSQCSLKCPGGFDIHEGPETLTCGEDGAWSHDGTFGSCSRVCEALPDVPYGVITPKICTEGFVKTDTECIISCHSNMERVGSALRKCVEDETTDRGSRWTGTTEPTKCMARCKPLVPLPYSVIFPTNCQLDSKVAGDTCSFECDPGYLLDGSPELRCLESGKYSDMEPSCFMPCQVITVPNGEIVCDDSYGLVADGLGYVYKPGAKCNYYCKTGFAANQNNQVTCGNGGIWLPEPFCSPISDAFPIIQKIEGEMVCLTVSATGNDGTMDGSDWHLTTTENSTTGCQDAGNNAMWFWYGKDHIKHAQTGLCLTAEAAMADSLIYMQYCDISNPLQMWTCDAGHSYRFILKDTALSIDTLYWYFGPLLQSGTHSQTYWITYNSLLEAVGTICSYKVLGACPPINKKSMKATPAVCMGDEVEIWQQCAVSCEDNADFDGATSTVECQPTGEWKSLDLLFCRDHCPALPDIPNGSYDKTGCTTESKKHQSECKLICDDGYVLSNNLAYQGYLCTDGLWNGDMDVSCQDRCVVVPKAPENGKVTCVAKSCTVECNLGYKLSGGSATFQCTEGVDYVEDRGIVCEEEFQFQIKSESAVYSAMIPHCITAMLKDGTTYAVKTPCVSSDLNQFWRWEDSREGTMYSKLQNIGTGECLSAVSNSSILLLNKCHRQDDLQQWACHDYLNPGKFGLVSKPRTYVDVGSTHPGTPLLLREDDLHMDSAKWVAHDFYGNLGFVCASRDSGSCPHPTLGTTTASHFDICNLHKAAPPGTKCDLLCYNSSYAFPDGETKHVIECKGGAWDHTARCIATESLMTCDPVSIPRHGIVTPAQCDENNGGVIYRGTVCSFTCEPGYILNGTTEMLCEETRTMSGTPHQCLEYCPGLTYTSGVKVVDPSCSSIAVLSGEACVLECDDGYVPADGAPSAWSKKCGSDGTWSGQDYFCVATCPKLSSSPYNATSDERQIATASLHRSSVTSTQCADSVSLSTTTCEFTCPVGDYVLQGPSAIRCESDGQWTESPPKCESVPHCPKLSASFLDAKYSPEPKDEDVSVPLDTVAKLSCQSGRMLKGDSVRKCRSDGTWSGDVDSDCALECPHLEALYGYTVQPPQCTTQTASHGTTCEYNCPDENDEFAENVACLNGAWGELTKRCFDTQEQYEVTNNADEFMLITHNPDGCLFVDDTDTVFWREKDACDPSQSANKWKWVEGHRISTARENLCLQPVDDSKQTTSLGVGNCVTAFRVGCGSPESAYRKYFLYAFSNPKWRMSYSIPTAASSMSVTMVKTEFTDSDVDPDSLEGIEVFANTNADNPRTTDRTVCSYMCGGVISPGQDSTTRAIMTPGFVEDEGYLVNSYCEWTFNSLGKVLVLRLQEIDINSSVEKECSPDCVQIFEGNAEGGVVSEHLTTYSGSDIYKQGSLEVKSASPSVTVAFTGISGGPYRGFSMMYRFEDLPASSTDCGTRQQYDAIASNSSSSVVDEVAEYRGQSAVATKWPWLVSVREIERGSLRAHHRCTGVLIGAQVVLSAAHCVRFTLASSTSQIHVGVGFVLQNEMDHEMRTHTASQPVYHIYYGYDSLTRYGDIALFNLREPVSMSDSVFPICMPSLGYKVHLPTSQCYSAGWSSPATGTRLNHIMDYKVDVHSSSWCKERLGLNEDVSFACVENVYVDGSGKNEKDESDPLMCNFGGNWYVAGVRSYTHVGARGTYRLYTEIHKFKDWILDTSDKIYLFDNSQGSSLL